MCSPPFLKYPDIAIFLIFPENPSSVMDKRGKEYAMKPVEKDEIKLRRIGNFYKAVPEYGQRVAEGLGLTVPQEV
jgi:catalase